LSPFDPSRSWRCRNPYAGREMVVGCRGLKRRHFPERPGLSFRQGPVSESDLRAFRAGLGAFIRGFSRGSPSFGLISSESAIFGFPDGQKRSKPGFSREEPGNGRSGRRLKKPPPCRSRSRQSRQCRVPACRVPRQCAGRAHDPGWGCGTPCMAGRVAGSVAGSRWSWGRSRWGAGLEGGRSCSPGVGSARTGMRGVACRVSAARRAE